ncbi:MAG: 5-formyltetrahydrofolate cyclo-ligase [Sphaerochaetaceae bacterium]|nr:5-formyltetrahydrofolate cyclo-ligase [Sphaerochaetaceae bacterium]
MTKQEIRKTMLRVAKETPGPSAEAVADAICSLEAYKNAQIVLGYVPLKSEVDVSIVMDRAVADGKSIAFPALEPGVFVLGDATWREHVVMLGNRTGSLDSQQVLHFEDERFIISAGIILVPGLAFTEFGTRLGRGAGYYDQTFLKLAKRNNHADLTSLGVCKKAQVLAELPTEPHDATVDVVLSF